MKIAALAGGVGGAKLAQGLAKILKPEELSIIVNTGDDFEYLGLHISPDVDTVCYTLAGIANDFTGWGLRDESYTVFEKIKQLNAPDWFKLGDKDLATHITRSHKMKNGETLTNITRDFCEVWGINHKILPMTDDPVRTYMETIDNGFLPFQEYFVKNHFEPRIKSFFFQGIDAAHPTEETLNSIRNSDVVIICPSNPFVSIDPIISLPGIKLILEEKYVIAVSPLIGGKAIKGPLAKMFLELNIDPSIGAIADHYKEFLNCLFIDDIDKTHIPLKKHSSIIFKTTNIMLPDIENRIRLASEIVSFLENK